LLGAGILAGLLAWLGGELFQGAFDPTLDLSETLSGQTRVKMDIAMTQTSVVAYGILGGTVGLALGLTGGLARGSSRAARRGAVSGLVVGAAATSLLALVLVPIHNWQYDPDTQDLLLPLAVHGGIWAAAGLGGGLGFAIGSGGRGQMIARSILGGIIGTLLGTVVYELIGAALFPLSNTVEPIPSGWGARLLVALTVAVGAAAGLAVGLEVPREKVAPVEPEL
ncbi:MAG: hypothetical protein IRY99_13375, partial [Isosphaeraceae bacterium]|nr:hypothetical protein [Isosphaeraceae bacterium]